MSTPNNDNNLIWEQNVEILKTQCDAQKFDAFNEAINLFNDSDSKLSLNENTWIDTKQLTLSLNTMIEYIKEYEFYHEKCNKLYSIILYLKNQLKSYVYFVFL